MRLDLGQTAAWALVVVTAGLVLVGIWGVCETKHTLELSERAWVTPIGAQLQEDAASKQPLNPVSGQTIRFVLLVQNSGREPALDTNITYKSDTIDAYDPTTTDLNDIAVPENNTCSQVVPKEGRVVFGPGTLTGVQGDSVHTTPAFFATDDITNGSKFYVLLGCIAYNTFNAPHQSSFCYILESHVPARTDLNAPPPKRAFDFVNCSSGFSED